VREIKFRGKCSQSKRWVYGYYFIEERDIEDGIIWRDIPQIQQRYGDHFQYFDVDPATVGQYTGLKDKNGREIYEGDNILWGDKTACGKGTAIRVVVEYKGGCFGVNDGKHFHEFYHYNSTKWDEGEITDDMWGELPIEKYFRACFEVIGNIHDNPELLGGAG
jgi:uncharacterized phage protein (TIGR01671 family)